MKEQIKKDMVTAMKEKNSIARDILRVLKGEIERNEQTSKGKVVVSDSDIIKMIKKLIESIRYSEEDNGEIAILENYLPKQMTKEVITGLVLNYIIENNILSNEMGRVMGYFKFRYDGLYDGKILSEIVKSKLS